MNKYVSTILSILLVFALPVIAKDKKGELKKLLREAIANKKCPSRNRSYYQWRGYDYTE